MSEGRKTAVAAGVAVVVSLLAWASAPRTTTPDALQDRGTSFFPGFTDARMAQTLEVVDFDQETATAHPFKVQVRDGVWTIPSQDDYPADGGERLANTAAAIIALKKDNIATENVSEHERTGTLDPLDETLPTVQGRGTRVTIKGDSDRLLADIIIGKPLESRPGFRYVRVADQARVYVAEVGTVDISSAFTDWIDRDLLHIEWNDVDQAIIRDYSLDKVTRGVRLRDSLFLQKLGEDDKGDVLWTMRDLRAGEQVDPFRANLFNTALDELSILGVRPKPPGVTAGFTQQTGTLKVSQADLADLADKGFHFTAKGELVADEGEVLVHTRGGVFFRLWFGDIAYGDAGDSSATDRAKAAASKAPAEPGGAPPAGSRENRYMIVRASLDPTGIATEAERDAAQQRAARLEARFAPWYYVVSGQSFERLRLSRQTLTKRQSSKAQ